VNVREDDEPKRKPGRSKKPPADRLAGALRDNLKRRKAQARAKASDPATNADGKPQKEPG